ncbi:hypothetical protein Ahy_B02g058926 [Arachis hypogaea]|uniref:Aminotransferase-like plant mobile domain-containing protein n=1 Tax=Arachis hypogaea TaxID=3818 RepID=A0A445AFS5_ARAHY|nr:hypothetical protein Ahy_B02g058926 [Arachis hypogaea]
MEQQLLGYEDTMYRLDQAEHITGRLDRVAPQILRTRRNLMTWPPEQIRPYLRRVGFKYVAYMVEFKHNWPLASVLIEKWRPSYVSSTMQRDDYHPAGRDLSAGTQDRRELEQDVTEERRLRYTRGYMMPLIGDILFPYASDSWVHIKWLPLLEDLETCGQLSWGLGRAGMTVPLYLPYKWVPSIEISGL